MTEPLISVVIPTYNRNKRLYQAVNSVQNQAYNNLEIIIVDDGSEHPVGADEFQDQHNIKIVHHNSNKGANAARRTGIENSNGEYIAFLDDDDVWDLDKLERQVENIQGSKENIGLVYTGIRYVNNNNSVIKKKRANLPENIHDELFLSNPIGTYSSILVSRQVIDEIGMPDSRFPSWQDQEWYLRITRKYSVSCICSPKVSHYIGHEDKITYNVQKTEERTLPLFIDKFSEEAKERGHIFHKKMVSHAHFRVGRQFFTNGNYAKARNHLLKSIYTYPFEPIFYLYLFLSALREDGKYIFNKLGSLRNMVKSFYRRITI